MATLSRKGMIVVVKLSLAFDSTMVAKNIHKFLKEEINFLKMDWNKYGDSFQAICLSQPWKRAIRRGKGILLLTRGGVGWRNCVLDKINDVFLHIWWDATHLLLTLMVMNIVRIRTWIMMIVISANGKHCSRYLGVILCLIFFSWVFF